MLINVVRDDSKLRDISSIFLSVHYNYYHFQEKPKLLITFRISKEANPKTNQKRKFGNVKIENIIK